MVEQRAEASSAHLQISDEVRDKLVEQKVTCPFLGSAVIRDLLEIQGDPTNPWPASRM